MQTRVGTIAIILLSITCIFLLTAFVSSVAFCFTQHRRWTEKALFVILENDAILGQFEGYYSVHLVNVQHKQIDKVFPPSNTIGINVDSIAITPNAVIGSYTSPYGNPDSGYFIVRLNQGSVHTFEFDAELTKFMKDNKIPPSDFKSPLSFF
jgi:hypothetical protein